MDTQKDNSISTHLNNGTRLKFAASGNGLYQYTTKDGHTIDTIWTMMVQSLEGDESLPMNPDKCFNIDTVSARSDKYTNCQIKSAQNAREMENIVMRPGIRKFTDICLPRLHYCPVTVEDVRAATDIFGENLGALKGKTTYRSGPHVKTNMSYSAA